MALRPNLRQITRQALILLFAGALGFASVWIWPRHLATWWMVVGLAGSVVAGVLIHELGHVLVGLTIGFRPVLLIAGPVRARRLPSGWRVDFGKLGFVGGAAVSIPATEQDLYRRCAIFIAGGAAANLVSAIGAATVASRMTLGGVLAGIFALVSVSFTFLALYPAAAAGVRTDGSRLLMLRHGGPEAERWLASFWIVALSFAGQRPSSWPEEWVRRATSFEDTSPDDFQAALILYAYALDRGDLAEAHMHLERAGRSLHATALISKPEYHIEAAFLAALDGNVEECDAHLASVSGTLIRQASLARARAAREWAAGNPAEAARYASQGIEAAPDDWDAGMAPVDLHWLRRFLGAIPLA